MDINTKALQYLIEHEYFERPEVLGIAKKILSEQTIETLSKKQKAIFDQYISPLLNQPCNGIFRDGIDSCSGDGTVDDESLLLSYREDNMLCQLCRYDKERHGF